MSFATYPCVLPFYAELHNNELLQKLIGELGDGHDIAKKVADLEVNDAAVEEHPFMTAFEKTANLTHTQNGAWTNATTRDSIIDLYYGIESVALKNNADLFNNAWKQDPEMAMHIILYARSIHRGKSLKTPFFSAYCWLLINHPQTALANLHLIVNGTIRSGAQLAHLRRMKKNKDQAESDGWDTMEEDVETKKYEVLENRDFKSHGYWKDLCTLLTIYCQGELEGPAKQDYLALHWPRQEFNKKNYFKMKKKRVERYESRKKMNAEDAAKHAEKYINFSKTHNRDHKQIAQDKRRDVRRERNKTVIKLLKKDKKYRALHLTIARLFANQLKKDLAQMEMNKKMIQEGKLKGKYMLGFNLSLASKWAPSLKGSHDKHTFLATSIAEVLFPPEAYQLEGESRVPYLNRVRELYRKECIVPLRKALDITEHYMQEGKWKEIDYRHVPSVCLQQNTALFFKHAPEEFTNYMEMVASGEKKVSGETLGPHELVYRAMTGNAGSNVKLDDLFKKVPELREKFNKAQGQLMNGQWNTLVQSIRDTSLLKSSSIEDIKKKPIDLGECLAICDVSGSMFWNQSNKPENAPIYPAIGLSLMISNLAKPPFNGGIITFSESPTLFKVDTSATFVDQVNTVRSSPMGYNTDLAKVFTDVLLPMAKKHNLAPEDMVKRLFIFTDMEFDAQCQTEEFTQTTHEFIQQQYREAGYEVPELVWWNLCGAGSYDSASTMNAPVTKDDSGVALLSGFSASMLKTFLDDDFSYQDAVDKGVDDKGLDGEGMGDEGMGDEGMDDDDVNDEVEEQNVKKKMTPMEFVRKAVYHESFNGIVIVD